MKHKHSHLAAVLLVALALLPAPADPAFAAADRAAREVEPVPTWNAPPVDVEALFARDAANAGRKELPPKVGFPMKTAITPATHGRWTRSANGDRTWRLRVASQGALWIVVGFSEFRLQPGARLYVSDAAGERVLGPYTAADIRPHGQLWFPPLEGPSALVELHWPASRARETPALRLGTVMHGYRPWGGFGNEAAFEKGSVSGPCNNDVACAEGNGWEDQIRSVVRLLDGAGSFCSGALINNTADDCTPYVLTAYHCFVDAPSTTFQFNYQRSQCGGGTVETTHTVTGSTRMARDGTSDFDLLLLDEPPAEEWNVYFSGWNRTTTPATRSTGIHHPSGDVKKISHNLDPLINGQFHGVSHWRVTEWEDGTTEPRSSGSPLYDQNRLIVGQLHGGEASCSNISWDEYGRFDRSWSGGATLGSRLSDFLDPAALVPTTLLGLEGAVCLGPPTLEIAQVDVSDPIGNGDGVADPGDTLDLYPWLANTGSGRTATSVRATLVALTPGVAVTRSTGEWPDIANGEQAAPLEPVVVEVGASVVCGQRLEFRLHAVAREGSWSEPFSLSTGSEIDTVTVFADDMESGGAGWSTVSQPAGNSWSRTTARSNSPSTSWFVNDLGELSDSVLVRETVPDVPPGTLLTFAHFMNSEGGFDGGVLEYSVDQAASWLDAGAMIVQGGYNATISTLWQSPLGGRAAWSGDLDGWQEVVVDLSPLIAQDVTFRWRFASDTLQGDEGWFVDDVVLTGGVFECNAVRPGEAAAPGEVAPLRVERAGESFALSWGAPPVGGAVDDYLLYSMPLASPRSQDAVCEGSLGAGTTADLAALPDDVALLVVARNVAGEGSYGTDGSGGERPAATTPCP